MAIETTAAATVVEVQRASKGAWAILAAMEFGAFIIFGAGLVTSAIAVAGPS
jgi:hypothetical protein